MSASPYAAARGVLRATANTTASRSCRSFSAASPRPAHKVVCALYPDPQSGYPPPSVRDTLPNITKYANGQTSPSPSAVDFKPGELLGCVSGALGLSKFLKGRGIPYVVTSDKDGAGCELDRNLHDASIVISQPFW